MWAVFEQSCFPAIPEKRIAMMATESAALKYAADLNFREQFKERNLSKFIAREDTDETPK